MEDTMTLYELNNLVRGTLELTLDDVYWIEAELSEVRVASNGHCYVEFIEKDARSRHLLAKARGTIWANVYELLRLHFERSTGQRLAPGLKVRVAVRVRFHELYGYSLDVSDIDPTYTLGDMARRRREILQQLEEEGVIGLNKELPLPRLVQRVAVISSDTAAGYGDFCHQLEASGYRFVVKLFPAAMQGDRVEPSVIAALDAIAAESAKWDAVAILRGGGAVSDLAGFDTYLLATNCAQFPLPILTGIGHERDDTVIDYVAHTRLKTPTAVADFLTERMAREDNLLADLTHRLLMATRGDMAGEKHRLKQLEVRIPAAARLSLSRHSARLKHNSQALYQATARLGERTTGRLLLLSTRLHTATARRLEREHSRLARIDGQLKMASPERYFRLGFSVTLKDGKALTDATKLKTGDRLITLLANGRIESVLTHIESSHHGKKE